MTSLELAKLAAEECCSEKTTAHHGGPGRPFWNAQAYQFMYVPAFQFQPIPGKFRMYRYIAIDSNGVEHTFDDFKSTALLTPIWADIPEGVVKLKVYAITKIDDRSKYEEKDFEGIVEGVNELIGARTFYKLASFPADLTPAVCSYKEAAAKAYDYAMNESFINHWLEKGTPDPDYDLNVYPSKMISSIIDAMIQYAKVCPDKAEKALKVATNSADYLIKITFGEGTPLEGLPPTYQIDFREKNEKYSNFCAEDRLNTMMMIYPAHAGSSYLLLEKTTGEIKYLDAAIKIGQYYASNVQPNGSWYLVNSTETGETLTPNNYCDPLERIVPFLMGLYERTGEELWKKLADNAIAYVEKDKLQSYEWEAQFEDSVCSVNYDNLTHYGACALIRYYTKYFSDNEEYMEKAADLMRFVEDQFVIWKNPSPWNRDKFDTSLYVTPCGLEQYAWYVPIDSSTADIIFTFLAMHKVTGKELYLAKAKALADSLTKVQQPSGMIPTHWMSERFLKGSNFWINCMFNAANSLADISSYINE